jgi:putative NADH-flavin reductase
MRISVFGATGGTGHHVVRQALEAGHDVTAVVRQGAATDRLAGARILTAEVTSAAEISPALDGADAVISALGPRSNGPTSILHDGTRAITDAMTTAGVKRLVVISMAPVTDDGDGFVTRTIAKPILKRVLRYALADSINMEEHLRQTGLDWTVVRPPRLTNGKYTGRYRTAHDANVRGGISVSRANVAAAILATLEDPTATRAAIGVAH